LQRLLNLWDAVLGYRRADPIKKVIKVFASKIPILFLKRLEPYALINSEFSNIKTVPTFKARSDIWDKALSLLGSAPLVYVEFGVYQGESIAYFADKNKDPASVFFGFDSFEGLPETWGGNPKGFFSTLGNTPEINDSRVRFISGWFVDSWVNINLEELPIENLLVHYDADLYSSTLFALSKINDIGKEYYAIFDEFTGQESRALSDYLSAFNAKVEFVSKQDWRGYPEVVLCRITPRTSVNIIKIA
jgi:O-methyltransferase